MLLSLNNVSFSFGARTMLNEVNWMIGEQERIGLIGPNGAGKSTLLRLIMGEYSVESGNVQKANNITVGFFNQDLLSFSTNDSILKVGITAFENVMKLEKKLEEMALQIEEQPDNEDLLMRYSETLHDFEIAGGYEMEFKAAEVLEGLGFSTADLQRPYNEFSGGWRMRVLLAKLMLQSPDILMLDEPTNHLDLPSIEWLERYLQSYPGTVIIVSHDRYFLDRMVTKIVELFQQKLYIYSGNYEFYEEEKATRMEFLEREFENQQKYIKQQEKFIERFRAKATKAAQAQSAIKRLDKLEKIELPDGNVPKMNISFDVDVQPGKIICDLKNISKSYGKLNILNKAQAEIIRGDKIALIGANGKGKSTLMRIIANMETFEGERSGWHNVKESFYAQHQLESLTLTNPILEELKLSGNNKTELEIRQLLGCFLFTGDDVFKKISVLSGGEKARVALSKVIAGKANFLMLDEPTNHLDIQSVELLIEALNQYQGTYVLISHDRYFVSKTANKYWEIEDGKIVEFKGPYEEYLIWKQARVEKQKGIQKEQKAKPVPVVVEKKESPGPDQKKEILKLHKQLERNEEELTKANDVLQKAEQELGNPEVYADKEAFVQAEKNYQKGKSLVAKLQTESESLLEKLIALES